VFVEYLHLMIDRGFPIEYFIEGTRSRSGRTLTPKAGILAMTVQSFVRSRARPLVFVPVYIGYEKLMEGGGYIAEMHGRPKKSESLLGLLRAARLLKRNFGRVHVNFGPPLALAGFLDAHHPDWRTESTEEQAPWLRSAVDATATELARRINSLAVVNPVNLLAVTLLSTPKHAADVKLLQKQIEHVQYLLAESPYAARSSPATCPAGRGDRVRPQVRLRRIPPPSARRHDLAPRKSRRPCSPIFATMCCTFWPCPHCWPAWSATTRS
jgi:glycerol-3-phosphate O-acyltransferase